MDVGLILPSSNNLYTTYLLSTVPGNVNSFFLLFHILYSRLKKTVIQYLTDFIFLAESSSR